MGPCEPSFGVGETYLIYANRWRGNVVAQGCLPTKHVDHAATELSQLGAPAGVFAGEARPVSASMPVSRLVRAYAVAGIGVYAYHCTQWACVSPPWRLLALGVVWTGHEFLSRDWSEPFLRW